MKSRGYQGAAIGRAPALAEPRVGEIEALRRLGCLDDALTAGRDAVRACPAEAGVHTSLGCILFDLQRRDEARAQWATALSLAANHADAHANIGVALLESGDLDGALSALDRAVALAPDNADHHFARAVTLLKKGDPANGFAEYEWRRHWPAFLTLQGKADWRGEPLNGRSLLITAEQGLGDALQFCRFVPAAAAMGGAVTLAVAAPLRRLFEHLGATVRVISLDAISGDFDLWAPLLSLPHLLGTRWETLPTRPYLSADPAAARVWGERLAGLAGLKVGLVWSGSPRPDNASANRLDRRRSIDIRLLAGLACPGVSFVSLQKERPPVPVPPELALFDLMDEMTDFADTAALIANLDLVIAVDTSTPHLAAAMGKPVWLLSRFDGCWRWLEGRDDSPWYPTLRLYRQTTWGDWSEPLARMAADLREITSPSISLMNGVLTA